MRDFRVVITALNPGDNAGAARTFEPFATHHPSNRHSEDAAYLLTWGSLPFNGRQAVRQGLRSATPLQFRVVVDNAVNAEALTSFL
jgi:hypothetical protein